MNPDIEARLTAMEAGLVEARGLLDRLHASNADPEAARLQSMPPARWTRRDRHYVDRWLKLGRQLTREADRLFGHLKREGAALEALADDLPLEGQRRLAALTTAVTGLHGGLEYGHRLC